MFFSNPGSVAEFKIYLCPDVVAICHLLLISIFEDCSGYWTRFQNDPLAKRVLNWKAHGCSLYCVIRRMGDLLSCPAFLLDGNWPWNVNGRLKPYWLLSGHMVKERLLEQLHPIGFKRGAGWPWEDQWLLSNIRSSQVNCFVCRGQMWWCNQVDS